MGDHDSIGNRRVESRGKLSVFGWSPGGVAGYPPYPQSQSKPLLPYFSRDIVSSVTSGAESELFIYPGAPSSSRGPYKPRYSGNGYPEDSEPSFYASLVERIRQSLTTSSLQNASRDSRGDSTQLQIQRVNRPSYELGKYSRGSCPLKK